MENYKRKRSEKNIIKYQRQNHFSFLEDLRKEEKLCDVTIKVGEQTFEAHKIILVGAIDYFKKMFLNDFMESNQKIITIQDIKPCNMKLFLNFAYTGKIIITEVNAQELMIDASFLGLTDIMNECSKLLVSHLTPNNALEIYLFAEALSCTSLHDKSFKFVQENFLDVSLTDQYLELSIDDLKKILSTNNLHELSQQKVFAAVVRWVKNNVEERKQYLIDLLKIIELSKISDIYLDKKVMNDELFDSLDACRDLVKKVIYNQTESRNQMIYNQNESRNQGHILLIKTDDMTPCILRSANEKMTIGLYHPITNKWNRIKTIDDIVGNNYIVYANKVYMFSVSSSMSSKVFDYKEISLKSISSMPNKRYSAGVVALNGYLYVCGGFDSEFVCNNTTNTVERYCPITDQWEIMSSLNDPRIAMATVSLQGYIYVMGGCHEKFDDLNTVERYDPQSNQWIIIDSRMLTNRNYPGAAVLNEKIYVCGGEYEDEDCDNKALSSVEVYDPESNSWKYVASMNEERRSPIVVAHMNKLWVFGGKSYYTFLSSVEVYDPENNIWSYVSPLEDTFHFIAGGAISTQ